MSVSPYMDSVLGVSEGGSQGAQLLAGLSAAGISAGPYAPLIMGASMATNALGKYLAGRADAPYERMQMRLGNQQLELGSVQIAEERRKQAAERAQERKRRAAQGMLSGIFSKYSQLKGTA